MILCGGKGTRLREQAEYRPKPMVEIGGKEPKGPTLEGRVVALEEQVAALIALHPTPTPTPIPIPPRDLIFDQPVAISGSAGITGWRSNAVVDGQGTVHVVWISTPTPSSIMYTSKPAGGVWSQPFNVSGQTKGVLQQDLAVSPDGSVHVVWRQFEEIDGRGFASVFYASLTPGEGWTSPVDIDQSQIDVVGRPLIAVDGTGRVHVVWETTILVTMGQAGPRRSR